MKTTKNKTETCANCGYHKIVHDYPYVHCKKFKPQSQRNSERQSLTPVTDTLRGIFDCTDLEKEQCRINLTKDYWFLEGKIKERQRIKAEVEKVLDDFFKDRINWAKKPETKLNEALRFLYVQDCEELKKRLGIK